MIELRPVQKIGVAWILKGFTRHKGLILADKVGLGKTAQAIAVLKHYLKKYPESCLVIVPAYLIPNWLDELQLWGIHKKDICVIDKMTQILIPSKIYLVSYTLLARTQWKKSKTSGKVVKCPGPIFTQLHKLKYSLIICDEAHYLKEETSYQKKFILGSDKNFKTNLLNRTRNILLFTGTPIINRVGELYTIISRIAPEVFKYVTRTAFIERYAQSIRKTPWKLEHSGVKNAKELKEFLKSVMLHRNTIEGVKEPIITNMPISLKGSKIKEYIKEEMDFLSTHNITEKEIEQLQEMSKKDAATLSYYRCRIALQKIPIIIQAALDLFINGENQICIFCHHREVLTALNTELAIKCKDKKIASIHGGVPIKHRTQIIAKFQKQEIHILTATIDAIKEGVNLFSGKCILYLELPWTSAALDQTIARLNRYGQKGIVNAYLFYYASGLDLYILKTINRKKRDIKKIMG